MKQWQKRPHCNCLLYMQEEETILHIMHCEHKDDKHHSDEVLWILLEKFVRVCQNWNLHKSSTCYKTRDYDMEERRHNINNRTST